jgi:signal recognition particle subunit SRP72
MSLSALLARLDVFANADSHNGVYDTAASILSKDPTNIIAIKQCLVALINMDKYSEAKRFIATNKDIINANTESLVLELAYVYYKLVESEDKLLNLKSFTKSSNERAFYHILAQYYYRIGHDIKSLKIYQSLIDSLSSSSSSSYISTNEELDLSVNERAVISQLKFQNNYSHNFSTAPFSKSFSDSYDQLFNDSLIQIIDGQYEEALISLNKTLKLADDLLNDYDNDEKFLEIAPIQLQIVYVHILKNEFSNAISILENLESHVPSNTNDINTKIIKLIIQNNKLVCSNQSIEHPSLLYRELGFPNSLSESNEKLTIPQISILERNHLLLAKILGKNSKNEINRFNKTFPISQLFRSSKLSLALISSQVAINSENYQRSIALLESVIKEDESILLNPSIGKLLLVLYEKIDSKKSINNLVNKIANLLLLKENDFSNDDLKYSKLISLKLLSRNKELADKILAKIGQSDLLALEFNDNDIKSIIQSINIDDLVSQGLDSLISNSNSVKSLNDSSKTKGNLTKRIRRKSKKLPKDLTQPLDPERWLPLKDRSYYRSKKSKKSKSTQGGSIDAATEKSLNISEKTTTPPLSASSLQNKNSKKKKGKK